MTKKYLIFVFVISSFFLFTGCIKFSESKNDYGGVFKSVDGGNTFANKSLVASVRQTAISFGMLNVISMTIDPQDNKGIYAGTDKGLFYSYNGGEFWHASANLSDKRITAIAINPLDKCDIYAGIGNKIYLSKDCNRTFQEAYTDPRAALVITKIFIYSKANSALIYAGTSQGDLLKSADNGQSWTSITNLKYLVNDIFIEPENPNIIFVATNKNLFKTIDGGNEWKNLSEQIGKALARKRTNILKLISTGNSNLVALTKTDIIRTENAGESWERLKLITPPGKVDLYSIAINPSNPKEIYYSTSQTLVKTIDNGATWKSIKLPSSRPACNLLIDHININVLYMGMCGENK